MPWLRRLIPPWHDRNFLVVILARLAMSAARAIAAVVTAIYLAALGFSGLDIGLLFVAVTAASALMSAAIGLWSDRVGRKPFLVATPLAAALAAAVYAGVRAAPALYLFAALGTFGRGSGAGAGAIGPYQPAESAFVAETVPTGARASAFGRLSAVAGFGALIGGLLALSVHARAHMQPAAATAAYRPAFVAAAVLAAAAGLVALGLSEDRPSRAGGRGALGERRRRRTRWPRRSWAALWRFWVTNGVNGLAIGLFGPFVSYWLNRRYGASAGEIGVLFAVVNAGALVSTLSAAAVARRVGTVRAIAAARAASGLLLVPMALAPNFWIAGAVYFVRMVVQRIGLPLRQAFTQDLAHPEERASVAALANLPSQATMAGSQALAGYLFDEVSLSAPFELAALLQCVNALSYLALFSWRPPRRAGKGPPAAEEPGARTS